jgi:hypothetical protein
MFPMHLGGFDTDPIEIVLLCPEHLDGTIGIVPRFLNHCVWTLGDGGGGNVFILALTDNAWKHRRWNHPNIGKTEMVSENPIDHEANANYVKMMDEEWKKFIEAFCKDDDIE